MRSDNIAILNDKLEILRYRFRKRDLLFMI